MNTIKEQMKLAYIKLFRFLNQRYYIYPIQQNKIVFEAFSGSIYGCSPKYISRKLHELYGSDVQLVWAVKDPEQFRSTYADDGVLFCKYRSAAHVKHRMTAKVYVSNFLEATEIPKRKGQVFLQTWHGGGCYKRLGSGTAHMSVHDIRRNIQVAETDYFLVSSQFFEEEVVRKQLCYTGRTIRSGMPRNDVLFHIEPARRAILRQKLGLEENVFTVLYAPTWSQSAEQYEQLNATRVRTAFKERFGRECVLLYRAHLNEQNKSLDMVDVSSYGDMQELLYLCDALITDYSSSIWDYSFTLRPCFLFAPDVDEYIQRRGFGKPIEQWGFPLTRSNDELEEAIQHFSERDFAQRMQRHHDDLGSFETGTATNAAVDLIAGICELMKEG